MIDAMECSCVENIHYGGSDPEILAHLEALGLRRYQADPPRTIWQRFKNFFTR